MSLRYLPEHAQPALLALDLACKEAKHLHYSQTTLFALPIDLAWVQNLAEHPELAEKVEAFVSRFGRLQDHLGEKLRPRLAALVGETCAVDWAFPITRTLHLAIDAPQLEPPPRPIH